MPIKSIIIKHETTAKRLTQDQIELDIHATPLNEENDAEPQANLKLYINGQLQENLNLSSGMDGVVRKKIVVNDKDSKDELMIQLKEMASEVSSKLRYILLANMDATKPDKEEKDEEKKSKWLKLYELNRETLSLFTPINLYFQELIKPENAHDGNFINQEFQKTKVLAEIKYKIELAKKMEFGWKYEKQILELESYAREKMNIHEINTLLNHINSIINDHNKNLENLRVQRDVKINILRGEIGRYESHIKNALAHIEQCATHLKKIKNDLKDVWLSKNVVETYKNCKSNYKKTIQSANESVSTMQGKKHELTQELKKRKGEYKF